MHTCSKNGISVKFFFLRLYKVLPSQTVLIEVGYLILLVTNGAKVQSYRLMQVQVYLCLL